MLIQLPNAFGDAAMNMAIDSALLATLPENIAVFRHYAWTGPAVTFGYTQAFAAVQSSLPTDLTLCRRSTGGGIVDHRNDWTYALIIQNAQPAAQIAATTFYEKLHRCLQAALAQQSIESTLAPCPRKCDSPTTKANRRAAEQCFTAPAANDILQPTGRKIAGAAMKRSRAGLLVQGSIDRESVPAELDFTALATHFIHALAVALDLSIGYSDDIRALFDSAKIAEERTRYSSAAWNQKR
ncbi:MAG: lipoate-protein ligase A [Lentimonas sp.]|jgi:lipoate-protein ligase A